MDTKRIPVWGAQDAIVDAADYERVAQYRWYGHPLGHAHANIIKPNGKYTTVTMQRLVMEAKPGQFIGHRNGNRLDNRRENLMVRTRGLTDRSLYRNSTSGYRGVSWNKRRGKWVAFIHHDRKQTYVGSFYSAKEAADARTEMLTKVKGVS